MSVELLRKSLILLEGSLTEKQTRRVVLQQDIDALRLKVLTLSKVEELFSLMLEKLVKSKQERLERNLTGGLRAIIFDQDLVVKTELTLAGNRAHLRYLLSKDGEEPQPLIGNFGGGVVCVLSVLLRIMSLLQMKGRKLLILDEPTANLSERYVEPMGVFLKAVGEKLGVDLLMITHTLGFRETANSTYIGELIGSSMTLELQK